MCRAVEIASATLMLLLCAATHAASSPVAARVAHESVTTAAIDAMSPNVAQHVHERLADAARVSLQQLIDERLGLHEPPGSERAARYRAHDVRFEPLDGASLEYPLPPGRVVASLDGEPIRASELERAAALRFYRLRGELYLQRRRDLDRVIERRLLELEAQDRGIPLEALERSFSEAVTDADVDAFLASERAAGRIVESPERVRPYLEFRKRYQRRASVLEARRARTPISILLEPPVQPRLDMDVAGGVALGPERGRTLVVYTNYVCALCRKTHTELDRLLAAPDPPRIVLHDFAREPAEKLSGALVRCAADNRRAAAMRRHLLRSPPLKDASLDGQALEALADIAGMRADELRACTESREIRARIEKGAASAIRMGFDDPPAFIAEGAPLSGMQWAEDLQEALAGKRRPLR